MSTTAQEEKHLVATSETQAPTPSPTPAAEQATSNSREYTLFEEARSDTWTKVGTVEAATQEAAIESLGEQKLKSGQGRFMAIPSRFVRPVKPKVTTTTTISFD